MKKKANYYKSVSEEQWINAPVSKTARQYIERQRWMSGYYD